MKKKIIVTLLIIITCTPVYIVLKYSKEHLSSQIVSPPAQVIHSKYSDTKRKISVEISGTELENKVRSSEIFSPLTTLAELRNKINSATDNKEFIQTILDIEHNASFNEIFPLIRELYDLWVQKNPSAALDYTEVLTKYFNNNSLKLYALEKAAIHNVVEAQNWLYQNNTGSKQEQDQNVLAIYSGLAVNDPLAALHRIDEINDIYYKHKLELRAIEEWAKHEPAQAMAWIENDSSFTHKIGINDAYMAVVPALIESAPLQAESIILGLQSSNQKNILVSQYTQKLALADIETAKQWARNITDEQAYNVAVSTTLEVIAKFGKNPSKAVEYASEEINPELKEQFITQAIGYIARSNPSIAASELSALPLNERKNIVVSIGHSFLKDEGDKKKAWIESLQNAGLRKIVAGSTP